MQVLGPTPHRPLRQTLLLGGAVIGFALVGAFILYLVTILLLWLRDDYCESVAPGTEKAA